MPASHFSGSGRPATSRDARNPAAAGLAVVIDSNDHIAWINARICRQGWTHASGGFPGVNQVSFGRLGGAGEISSASIGPRNHRTASGAEHERSNWIAGKLGPPDRGIDPLEGARTSEGLCDGGRDSGHKGIRGRPFSRFPGGPLRKRCRLIEEKRELAALYGGEVRRAHSTAGPGAGISARDGGDYGLVGLAPRRGRRVKPTGRRPPPMLKKGLELGPARSPP